MSTKKSNTADNMYTPPHLSGKVDEKGEVEKGIVNTARDSENINIENISLKQKGKSVWNHVLVKGKSVTDFILMDGSNATKGKSDGDAQADSLARKALLKKIQYHATYVSIAFFVIAFLFGDTLFMQRIFAGAQGVFVNWNTRYNVAFVGNSYLYINDVPRLLESISGGKIRQNSCIHASSSLSALLRTGNGMYDRWTTSAAAMRTNLTSIYNFIDEDYVWYDYGACSVYQLLLGYDNDLSYKNQDEGYYDDGSNPCFVDDYYLGLTTEDIMNKNTAWDYVVINDQTKRMAFEDSREESIEVLKYAYAPMLRDARATPILVDTHAFWSESSNMTGLKDVAYFTAEIYDGLREYVLALKYNLPDRLAPKVAPIGLAYLTIYEDNINMWKTLFVDDEIHASPAGSYLFACVLYCTIYGHLPHKAHALGGISSLFENSRSVDFDEDAYLTPRAANYLRMVARRVVLGKHVPKILSEYGDISFHLNKLRGDDEEYEYYWNGYDNSVNWKAESKRNNAESQWNAEVDEYEGN